MLGKYNIELNNGDQKLAVKYTPAQFDIIVDGDFPFEKLKESIEPLYELGCEFLPLAKNFNSTDKLRPLTIFVKEQTKEFLKNNSDLTVGEILEMYESFNHDADALINSLLNDERFLENKLVQVRQKIQNAQSFKDELNKLDLENNETCEDTRVKVEVL